MSIKSRIFAERDEVGYKGASHGNRQAVGRLVKERLAGRVPVGLSADSSSIRIVIMLTLTRKPEETIVIGEGPERIEVTVREIRRNQVRLGIMAPDNIRIFRKELLAREDAEESVKETGLDGELSGS